MGMSASQARLLSITSRLTNNEFRAQTITNSKLRLAEKSQEASSEYMDALNSQQLVFGVYGDNGEYKTQELTPALIYDYQPLKNQYALVNPAGKILVSALDAKNFEETNSLHEFLERYDLFYTQEVTTTLTNVELGGIDNQLRTFLNDNGYSNFSEYFLQTDLNEKFNDACTLADGTTPTVIGNAYNIAKGEGNSNGNIYEACLFLLNHFLNNKFGKTTTTEDVNQFYNFTTPDYNTMNASLADFSEKLREDARYCDGDDDSVTEGQQNNLSAIRENGTSGEPTNLDRLKSDYIETSNGDGTYSYTKKTLYQKALDMYYIIQKNNESPIDTNSPVYMTSSDISAMFKDFIENDLKKPQAPDFTFGNNLNIENIGTIDSLSGKRTVTVTETIENVIEDKTKAQWYINLWYMMNGSDTANIVKQDEYYDVVKEINLNIFSVDNQDKSGNSGNFEVFEDMNLYKSSEWLQFALEHGMVTMYQAQYTNPADNSGKNPELSSKAITWQSIIYTNASDITSKEDEVAIAIAEVKYKNTITEIENQDKKYDQDLKKLDTEHTALQTEYESIKEVISKNVERSFKAFS